MKHLCSLMLILGIMAGAHGMEPYRELGDPVVKESRHESVFYVDAPKGRNSSVVFFVSNGLDSVVKVSVPEGFVVEWGEGEMAETQRKCCCTGKALSGGQVFVEKKRDYRIISVKNVKTDEQSDINKKEVIVFSIEKWGVEVDFTETGSAYARPSIGGGRPEVEWSSGTGISSLKGDAQTEVVRARPSIEEQIEAVRASRSAEEIEAVRALLSMKN